jgi:hypothetical protein
LWEFLQEPEKSRPVVEGQKKLCDDGQALGGYIAMSAGQSSAIESDPEVADGIDEAALASVLRTVPFGAAVLAGSTVALLVLGYLLVYLLVFLPRGIVG